VTLPILERFSNLGNRKRVQLSLQNEKMQEKRTKKTEQQLQKAQI
jgi:hypothetical protein